MSFVCSTADESGDDKTREREEDKQLGEIAFCDWWASSWSLANIRCFLCCSFSLIPRGLTKILFLVGIVIGSIVGLLLLLLLMAIVVIILRIAKSVARVVQLFDRCLPSISRRRRAQSLKYLNNQDDQRRHLNTSGHSTSKGIQIEHPHLLPSSMINSENLSDREALLQQGISTSLDNLYEEIKEHHHQQQQRGEMNFTLGKHPEINPYLAPKSIDDTHSSQPIRDHREVFYYEC